jgi:hypothetical protein
VKALAELSRRRELVLMSCDMQRMTLAARLARVERHRGLAWAAAALAAVPIVRAVLKR